MLLLAKAKSIRNSRHAPLIAVGAVVFLVSLVYLRPAIFTIPTFSFSPSHPVEVEISHNELLETTDLFDDPFLESPAIKNLCERTEWNPKVLFTCNRSGGGVGNLRNSILNCVRYAISAGAGLTLPRVILRDPNDISHIWERETISFDYIFDETHFVESLRLSCPQLQLFDDAKEFQEEAEEDPILLLPESLMEDTPTGIAHPERWRGKFYGWLSKERDTDSRVVVDLDRSYLKYPIYSDMDDFALSFGKILKFRKEARELATTVLKNLASKYDLHANFGDNIWKNTFFGAHLRTEVDSQRGFPVEVYEYSKYSVQSHYYLDQASTSGLPVIYLASGDVHELYKFTQDAHLYNITVSTKHDLVNGEDKTKLENLTFDQQALVDYLVLMKSSEFAGVGHSSFAWNIALWRHQFAKQRDHLSGPQLMSDELSQIYGTVGQYLEYAACLWP
ncbi:uncharacterized protein PAC_07746 [Phialocephala subalpina]|uniref:Alternative oxidase n=1 Tax=Phialocephala subalpina TaxID=576137 RepID=A0A1L7WYK6_9HELO|nr:uncharacterized protein PAC_07746 [Phialocephala subalpina]